jgi:predicted nucleic acid-binding protein
MRMVRQGLATWVSSTVLHVEVSRNPFSERRHDAESLLLFANEIVVPSRAAAERARRFDECGFSPFDALHLACAEEGRADVFLTTDDDLVRCARRCREPLHIKVENPVLWYEEALL